MANKIILPNGAKISSITLPNNAKTPHGFKIELFRPDGDTVKIKYQFSHNKKWFELIQKVSPQDEILTIPLKTAFVSYCKKNKEEVFTMTRELNEHGVLTWFDEDNLIPGTVSPETHIEQGLLSSDHIIVFLSKEAIAGTGMQQKEIEMALKIRSQKRNPNLFIVPIILDESSVPSNFEDIQYVRRSDSRWLEKTLKTIKPFLKEA